MTNVSVNDEIAFSKLFKIELEKEFAEAEKRTLRVVKRVASRSVDSAIVKRVDKGNLRTPNKWDFRV